MSSPVRGIHCKNVVPSIPRDHLTHSGVEVEVREADEDEMLAVSLWHSLRRKFVNELPPLWTKVESVALCTNTLYEHEKARQSRGPWRANVLVYQGWAWVELNYRPHAYQATEGE